MAELTASFIQLVNQNIAIAHKVSRIFFDDPADREDAVQEMMYQLWRSFESFDGKSKFSTWMYRVCLNTSSTYRRRRSKHEHQPLTSLHAMIESQSDSKSDETINLLYQAIGQLTALNKAIVLLYLEDLSYDEIANITGLTKSNVSVRIMRIKKELESIIKKLSNTSEHVDLR